MEYVFDVGDAESMSDKAIRRRVVVLSIDVCVSAGHSSLVRVVVVVAVGKRDYLHERERERENTYPFGICFVVHLQPHT